MLAVSLCVRDSDALTLGQFFYFAVGDLLGVRNGDAVHVGVLFALGLPHSLAVPLELFVWLRFVFDERIAVLF